MAGQKHRFVSGWHYPEECTVCGYAEDATAHQLEYGTEYGWERRPLRPVFDDPGTRLVQMADHEGFTRIPSPARAAALVLIVALAVAAWIAVGVVWVAGLIAERPFQAEIRYSDGPAVVLPVVELEAEEGLAL